MYTVGDGIVDNKTFILNVINSIKDIPLIKDNKSVEWYNVPAAFDIEVSSFYQYGQVKPENKRAIMYIWQFGIYNHVTTGRTWKEFISLLSVLSTVLKLSNNRRLVIYVHNLPYEFQFIRKRFKWERIFLLDKRKPVVAQTSDETDTKGFEFRCSLKLSGGKSLENVGKDLQKYICRKMVGDLDYNIIRTPQTPLTQEELKYCENDIRVLLCYIQEKIEQDGDITRIPLTNTGYVRNYCRKYCYRKWKKYRAIMQELTITTEEYSQLKRAFQGGFTHANAHYSGKILENVASYDFTSSYPAVMVLEKFPMSKGRLITEELTQDELNKLLHTKCCLFNLTLYDVIPIKHNEHPLSESRCYIKNGVVTDNGRVVTANRITTTVTEQDFFVYIEFYSFSKMEISELRIYEKQYLPKQFIKSVMYLYKMKTELKDIKGEEVNYAIWKNMLNACYGMSVTDPVRESFDYHNNEYVLQNIDIDKAIDRYNKNVRRFLFYPWGVWVTAYARANLFSGIIACGNDYVYSDTDSCKIINPEYHREYFNKYNEEIIQKIKKASASNWINEDEYSPVNKNGKSKTIGIWDYEGVYDRFKTLGAKRYMTYRETETYFDKNGNPQTEHDVYSLTVAGTNKKKSMKYLKERGNAFEEFQDNLVIPSEYSGRLTITPIDEEIEGEVIDYLGHIYHYHEFSAFHMEPSKYELSLSKQYIDYLNGLEEILD